LMVALRLSLWSDPALWATQTAFIITVSDVGYKS
jgi:hypothetical protein